MKVINPFNVNEVVDKDNVNSHLDMDIDVDTASVSGVAQDVIPVTVEGLQQVRYTRVQAGIEVPEHSHDGPEIKLWSGSVLNLYALLELLPRSIEMESRRRKTANVTLPQIFVLSAASDLQR